MSFAIRGWKYIDILILYEDGKERQRVFWGDKRISAFILCNYHIYQMNWTEEPLVSLAYQRWIALNTAWNRWVYMRWGHVLPGEDSAARWGQSHSPGLHRHSSLPRHRVTSSGPRKWVFFEVFASHDTIESCGFGWQDAWPKFDPFGASFNVSAPCFCVLRVGSMMATMEAWGPITGWHAAHLKSVLRMSLQIFLRVFGFLDVYIHFRRWYI